MPSRAPAVADELSALERALFRVARIVAGLRVSSFATGAPIDRAGLAVLGRLEEEEGLRLSTLAQVLGLDLSTVSRQVRQLEDGGLLRRADDPADRRASRLYITPEGERVLTQLRAARRSLLCDALATWSRSDREQLTTLLTRLGADLRPDLRSETRTR